MKRKKIPEGKIIKEFEIGKDKFVLRYPKRSDIKQMLNFINFIIRERAYLNYQKPITLKIEKIFFPR